MHVPSKFLWGFLCIVFFCRLLSAQGPVPGHYSVKLEKVWGQESKGQNADGSVPEILLSYSGPHQVKLTLINWGEIDRIFEKEASLEQDEKGIYQIRLSDEETPMGGFSYDPKSRRLILSIIMATPKEFELVTPIMEIRPGIYRADSSGQSLVLDSEKENLKFQFINRSDHSFEEFSLNVPRSFRILNQKEDWSEIFTNDDFRLEYGIYSGKIKFTKTDGCTIFSWDSLLNK